jgi:hypothetical protein
MFRDPIDWPTFKAELLAWSESADLSLSIPRLTDCLFRERLQPNHRTRTQELPKETTCNVYKFFDPHAPIMNESTHLKVSGIDAQSAHIINKINQQNRSLSALGIIPNQLRTLTKNSVNKYEQALSELSQTLFWKGYAIWKRRKALVTDYWKRIARDDWKPYSGKKQTSENKRRERSIKAVYQCGNPFHFLEKLSELSGQRPTPCLCSRKRSTNIDFGSRNIQSFLHTHPRIDTPDPLYQNYDMHIFEAHRKELSSHDKRWNHSQ